MNTKTLVSIIIAASTTVVALLAILALAGCDQKAWIEKFVPIEEAEFSKDYLSLFQSRDFESIEARLRPSLRNERIRPKLEQIAGFFPSEKPKDIQTIGAHSFTNGDLQQFNLTFQYQFSDQWLLANVVLQKRGAELLVTAVNVQPIAESLEKTHWFSLEGKSLAHYVVLGFALVIPLFVITVLVLCARTPIPSRKWLWILFVLVGLGQISFNWTDGSLNFNPLSFQLLGAGFMRASTFAPLILSVSVPIGAIVFLLKQKSWLVKHNEG